MAEVAEQYEDEPHLQVDSVWVLKKGITYLDGPGYTENQRVSRTWERVPSPPQTRVKFCSISRPISMSTSREHGHQVSEFGTTWRSSVRETPSSLGAI